MTVEEFYKEAKDKGITDFELKIGYKDGQTLDVSQIYVYLGDKKVELT